MLVANSFDLWKKDFFFSAAEEVQESADRMESAYHTWMRGRRGATPEFLDELSRELQTALGTAKWQLEEFERAVRMSYGNHSDDISKTRHRQFVSVMENQISHIEAALKEFFSGKTKQPLRWINLDEEERDDLALFLSGSSGTSHSTDDSEPSFDTTGNRDIHHERVGSKDVGMISNNDIYHEANDVSATRDDINCQTDGASASRRTWSSPNLGVWKIVIADSEEQKKKSVLGIDAITKDKESKPLLSKQRCRELPKSKGGPPSYIQMRGTNWISQNLGRLGWFQGQPRSPRHMQFGCSVRVALALMLSIFLIVPFVLYSN